MNKTRAVPRNHALRQVLPAPIDPAPFGRAAARPGTKFRSPAMSIAIDRRPSSRDIAPSARFHSNAAVWRLIVGARLTVARWFARSRQRRALREIAERNDFHLLKDIG